MTATRIGKMLRIAAAFAAFWAQEGSVAEEQATLKVFYFGNSFLENSVPWFHPTLAATAGHVRAGLPRYTLAATCFAVMFGTHPNKLDGAIYNNLDNYKNENLNKLPGKIGPGYVHWPDLGELLEITPERKKIVDDTIWELVQGHPYTQVK